MTKTEKYFFKRFPSIENSYRQKYIKKILESGKGSHEFLVEEKIHGANFSIWAFQDRTLLPAKRSGFIKCNESFFSYEKTFEENKEKVLLLLPIITREFSKDKQLETIDGIAVFGELFGGSYPHKEVKHCMDKKIANQHVVHYCPENKFIAFDIFVFGKNKNNENDGFFINAIERNYYLKEHDIMFCPPLHIGTLKECLEYNNKFQTAIPSLFGLPEIINNFCEGTVIKPLREGVTLDGKRIIIKNKNERFSEKQNRNITYSEKPKLPDDLVPLFDYSKDLVNDNRLNSILSKEEIPMEPKSFGQIMGLIKKDVMTEIKKDQEEKFESLTKEEKKKLERAIASIVISPFLKNKIMST